MRDTLVLCFIANPLAFCQLYHPLGLCQLYPFTMRVLGDVEDPCRILSPFGPQRKSESLIFTDFRFAHLMIYAFGSPINCSKRVSGEQKPLTNTCSPTRQLSLPMCYESLLGLLGILVPSFQMNFEYSQMLTYPATRVLCHRKSSPNKKD